MPRTRPTRQRLRAAAPVAGAASSVLRLAQPATARLPAGAALTRWVQRASASLGVAQG